MMLQMENGLSAVRNVCLLNQEQIVFYWSDIVDCLKDCPGYFDCYTTESTYDEIKTGRLLVWALSDGQIRGIVLTKILVFPKKKVFHILAVAGVTMMEFFKEMDDVFQKIGHGFGCVELSSNSRPGVCRVLRRLGVPIIEEMVVLRRPIQVQGDQ